MAVVRLLPRALAPRAIGQRGLSFAVVGALGALGMPSLIDTTVRSNVIAALAFVLFGALVLMSRLPIPGEGTLGSGGDLRPGAKRSPSPREPRPETVVLAARA